MTKYLSLTKALFKNSFSFIDQGKQKSSKKIIGFVLFAFIVVSLLPSLFGLYTITNFLLDQLVTMDQTGVLLALTFQGAGLIIFFFAVFLIPAIFYFSKDIEHLLSLPLKPVEIIGAKFTVTYVYETALMLFLLSPVIIAYITKIPLNVFQLLSLFVVVLSIPLLPLILAAILVMVVMCLVPLFKNRDLFNMLSGLIVLAIALWVNFAMGGLVENLTQQQLIDFIIEGNDSLISMFKFIFFTYPFGLEAILNSSVIQFLLYVGLTFITLSIFLIFSNIIYFKGVLGINETASSRKGLTDKQLRSASSLKPSFIRYLYKEIILLVRTPVYFLNCVSIQFLLPILLLASYIGVPSQQEALKQQLSLIDFTHPTIVMIVLILSIAFGLIIGSVNMISTTAISREGQNIYFMKIIPMNMMSQLNAKVASGISLSLIGLLVTYGIVLLNISLPLQLIVASLVLAIVAIVFINYFGLLIDVLKPKLVWESEQAAVKQNINSVFTMIPSMAIGGLLGYLAIKEIITSWIFVFGFAGLLVLATLMIYVILKKHSASIISNY